MANRLVCEACGQRDETGAADGWRGMLGVDDDDRETVVVLCPPCAFDVLVHSSPTVRRREAGSNGQ